jgi:hypothetical protein
MFASCLESKEFGGISVNVFVFGLLLLRGNAPHCRIIYCKLNEIISKYNHNEYK